jgi:ubiquinone biosynthesis protein
MKLSGQKWLKRTLERSGPLYVKIGQFIGNRPDLFGDDFSSEMSSLQTRATFFKATKPKEVYRMDPDPIAAASIAQVHTGVMADGRRIAIKIKRPNIDVQMNSEFNKVRFLAYIFPVWFRDFEKGMKDELDFSKEIRNLQKFHEMYKDSTDIRIPRVIPEISGPNHIVMEYVPSESILKNQSRTIAENLMNTFIEQILYTGVLHGDLHAGNLGVIGETIVMYDLGNVIYIPDDYMKAVREVLVACQNKEVDGLLTGMRHMGMTVHNESTAREFAMSFFDYLDTLDPASFKYSKTDTMIPIQLDDMTLKILRTYSLVEGICKQVYPQFTYEQVIQQNLELLVLEQIFSIY